MADRRIAECGKCSPLTRLQSELEAKIGDLLREGLVSEKDAAAIRNPQSAIRDHVIGPSNWMYWNVHLDGLERTHDLIVEREGVFKECILAIKMAKRLRLSGRDQHDRLQGDRHGRGRANVRFSGRSRS